MPRPRDRAVSPLAWLDGWDRRTSPVATGPGGRPEPAWPREWDGRAGVGGFAGAATGGDLPAFFLVRVAASGSAVGGASSLGSMGVGPGSALSALARASASTTHRTGVGRPHTSVAATRTASPKVCSSQSRHDSFRATTTISLPSETKRACPANQRLKRAAPTRADTASANRRSTDAGVGVGSGRADTSNSLRHGEPSLVPPAVRCKTWCATGWTCPTMRWSVAAPNRVVVGRAAPGSARGAQPAELGARGRGATAATTGASGATGRGRKGRGGFEFRV